MTTVPYHYIITVSISTVYVSFKQQVNIAMSTYYFLFSISLDSSGSHLSPFLPPLFIVFIRSTFYYGTFYKSAGKQFSVSILRIAFHDFHFFFINRACRYGSNPMKKCFLEQKMMEIPVIKI